MVALLVALAVMQAFSGWLELVVAAGMGTRPACSTWMGYCTYPTSPAQSSESALLVPQLAMRCVRMFMWSAQGAAVHSRQEAGLTVQDAQNAANHRSRHKLPHGCVHDLGEQTPASIHLLEA